MAFDLEGKKHPDFDAVNNVLQDLKSISWPETMPTGRPSKADIQAFLELENHDPNANEIQRSLANRHKIMDISMYLSTVEIDFNTVKLHNDQPLSEGQRLLLEAAIQHINNTEFHPLRMYFSKFMWEVGYTILAQWERTSENVQNFLVSLLGSRKRD